MRNDLKIMLVGAGAVLATGCGNMVNIQTAQTDEDKARFAGAPSYKDAMGWPSPVSLPKLDMDVVDTDSARGALDLARKEVVFHNGYEARVLLRKVAGYRDINRGIDVSGLFEEDLRNVLDGKPLQTWNRGKQKGNLEDEARGFLDFMSGVYETWFKSEPVRNEAETAFNNLIRAIKAREVYDGSMGKVDSIPNAIKKHYLSSGPDLERFLASKFKAEDETARKDVPVAFVMPQNQPAVQKNNVVRSTDFARKDSVEIPPSIRMRDYMDRESEKWMRGYKVRQAVKSVELGYNGDRENLFMVGDVTGKRTEIPESYARNSRKSVLKVARRN